MNNSNKIKENQELINLLNNYSQSKGDLSYSNNLNEIESDSKLILKIIFLIIKYIILLPFNLILLIFFFITFNQRYKEYFIKIINLPFNLSKIIIDWFLEAKYTSFLLFIMWIVFFIEIFFMNPEQIDKYAFSYTSLLQFNIIPLFTSLFLHGSSAHIISNSLALLIFGRIVEKHFNWKVLLIFLFSGVFANLISGYIYYYILNDTTPSLGASGGIAGLIFLAIMLEPFKFTNLFLIPLPVFLVGWILIYLDVSSIISNNLGQTNHFAHLAGYSSLLIILFLFEYKSKNKIKKGFIINIIMLLFLILIIKYLNINIVNLLNNI
jgi:membrane associated rhomboid family serine protease